MHDEYVQWYEAFLLVLLYGVYICIMYYDKSIQNFAKGKIIKGQLKKIWSIMILSFDEQLTRNLFILLSCYRKLDMHFEHVKEGQWKARLGFTSRQWFVIRTQHTTI